MTRLIFVHGAYANKHSWFDLHKDLETSDRPAIAETLPGHTGPYPRLEGEQTLSNYVSEVANYLSDDKDNWLIGHSMGGMVISQIAATPAHEEKVAGLIYIAGILPEDGRSTAYYVSKANPSTYFANHNDADIAHALTNQPPLALASPFKTSPGFAAIPKTYFICTQDKVITPSTQEAMADTYPRTKKHFLDSDHLPMHASDLQDGIRDELLSHLANILPD